MKYSFLQLFCFYAAASIPSLLAQSVDDECKNLEFGSLPYPDDNTAFIFCSYGKAQIRRCPANTCFESGSTLCTVDACAPAQQLDKAIVTDYCANNNLENVKVQSVSCTHFYVCLGAIEPVYVKCPNNMHYSQFEQKCVSPPEARCQSREKLCEDSSGAVVTYAASACNQYYECESGDLVKKSCGYGEKFDSLSGKCELDTSFSCQVNLVPNCGDPTNANVYFPHKKCGKFYFCANNAAFEGQCSTGYRFDRESASCMEDTTGICNN